MATTYTHVQIGVVDNNGNVNVMYPVNTGEDVSIDKSKNNSIPSSVTSVQTLVDQIGAMAFADGSDLVYIDETEDYDGQLVGSEIDDTTESFTSAWSSKKTSTHVEKFIPTYENDLNTVNYVPIVATKKVINGKDSNVRGLCPESGYIWFVDYTPYVTSEDTVAGNAGASNTVSYAVESWVGHAFLDSNEAPVVYERIYVKGSWSTFHKINIAFA